MRAMLCSTLPARPLRLAARALLALMALLGALTLSPAISAPPKPAASANAGGNWGNTVTLTPEGGHLIGNPNAGLHLVEYMSYTCPHCAHFQEEGVPTLRLSMIANGKGSFEVRHFLRDPVDMAVALLTNCVPPAKFQFLHDSFLAQQSKWLAPASNLSKDQQKRWFEGPMPTRMRAIANDLKLYDFVETRGLSRGEADRCLTNEALAKRIAAQTADAQTKGVTGTPGFFINGVLLTGTYDWATLRPQLEARL
ncbi:DsbA family protein [Novosphingobium terrae]|uniref:DsbA family protein n=1 Tax=Novosphingobium terrae TaxID=2726189 RepID=UPI001981DBE5|nr:thioredoxin domain-containing protein [Novosphingobium terrae]